MYPLDPHGVKKWGDMTLPALMDAPPMVSSYIIAIIAKTQLMLGYTDKTHKQSSNKHRCGNIDKQHTLYNF